jgi:hypothetical protein
LIAKIDDSRVLFIPRRFGRPTVRGDVTLGGLVGELTRGGFNLIVGQMCRLMVINPEAAADEQQDECPE